MTGTKPYPIALMDRVGIIKDLSPEQIPDGGWQDGKNVRFIDGRVKALFGYQRFYSAIVQNDASGRIMHGDQLLLQNGSIYLVLLTLNKVYYWITASSTFSDISGGFSFAGAASNFFMTDVGFNLFLICNGVDVAKKWVGPGNNIATLGGLTAAAPAGGGVIPGIIRPFANFLVAMNNTEDGALVPFRVRWSRIGQAELWVNAGDGSGQAGYNDLNDTPYGIKNGFQLGNFFAIYKTDGVYIMSYVGVPAVFDFRKIVAGRGLLAPRAIVPMGSIHYFLSDDNFYSFDGAQLTPISDDRVRDYFFNDLHPTYANRVQAILYKQFGEIWWAYPSGSSTGDFDKVLIYNYRRGTWSFATFGASALFLYTLQNDFTWANQPDLPWSTVPNIWVDFQLTSSSPLLMIGNNAGYVFQHGLVYSQDGASYTKQAISKLYDFQVPGVVKRLLKVQFSVDQLALTNLQVYVGTSNHPSDTITWNGPYTIKTAFGQPKIDIDLSAVYFAFRFESVGMNDPWEVMGFTPWTDGQAVQ